MLGDVAAFNKMQELAPDTPDNDALSERPDLQDLNVVCELCGYPPPYKAQIEMAEFVFDAANEPRLLLGARRYGKSEYSVILKAAVLKKTIKS